MPAKDVGEMCVELGLLWAALERYAQCVSLAHRPICCSSHTHPLRNHQSAPPCIAYRAHHQQRSGLSLRCGFGTGLYTRLRWTAAACGKSKRLEPADLSTADDGGRPKCPHSRRRRASPITHMNAWARSRGGVNVSPCLLADMRTWNRSLWLQLLVGRRILHCYTQTPVLIHFSRPLEPAGVCSFATDCDIADSSVAAFCMALPRRSRRKTLL